jgi:catechol 2,3-dioxygenase-like lactoylglutathione lyase family enzyme
MIDIAFVAGFGPITRSQPDALAFWGDRLGIRLDEAAPGYFTSHELEGIKAFALWPLTQAAEATFGTAVWPERLAVPQAWIEFDVPTADAVAAAVEELRGEGCDILKEAGEEPWGQVTSRVLSPEGLLVGISFTPWMQGDAAPTG